MNCGEGNVVSQITCSLLLTIYLGHVKLESTPGKVKFLRSGFFLDEKRNETKIKIKNKNQGGLKIKITTKDFNLFKLKIS